MGLERESFVGNPHKQDYIDDEEEDDVEYLSGDEIELIPFVLPVGDPDLMLQDNLDIDSDEDDVDYDPANDYEDFLSDSDFVADGTDGSDGDEGDEADDTETEVDDGDIEMRDDVGEVNGDEQDSDQDQPAESNSTETHEPTKTLGENKSPENKISDETTKTNSVINSTNQEDAD